MNSRRHAHPSQRKARVHHRAATPSTELSTPNRLAIESHIIRRIGKPAFTMHEKVSDTVHIDVHVVAPSRARPFWFLFTTGMSALPMQVPHEALCCANRYAELSILLPPTWQLGQASLRESRWFWPIRELYAAARLPHVSKTWLGTGHTIANGVPPPPLDPSTKLAAMIVLPIADEGCQQIPVGDRTLDLFTLWPIYPEELEHRLECGLESLVDALEASGTLGVIDPDRPSAV